MVTYGGSVNTAGWVQYDHQDTGMDGGPYLYFNHPIIQVKKTLEEEDGYDKMADTEVFFVSTSLGKKKKKFFDRKLCPS